MITNKTYDWLNREPGPKMLVEAVDLYGVTENAGNANNPAILAWASEAGIKSYSADSIPWCGLFVAICAKRAGKPLPKSPLWARGWLEWGNEATTPKLGDVLVFKRDGGGHVGLYVGEDAACYHVLGGNQGDCVCIKRIAKNRLIGARNLYAIGAPDTVRVVKLAAGGAVSSNEA